MAKFTYPPISPSQSIRLLLLTPSISTHTPLQSHLRCFNLSSLPKYEAISYTWESQIPSRPIECNGSTLLVTPNIENAMKHLRHRFRQRYLWIDAICIDQHNSTEQALQISLMNQIYRRAKQVVVWLGTGDDLTPRALWMLRWIFPIYRIALHFTPTRDMSKRYFYHFKAKFQSVLLPKGSATAPQELKTPSIDSLDGLRHILHHSWFQRIWTFQEVCLAKKAMIRCGSSTISWSTLSKALTFDAVLRAPRISIPVLMEGGYNPVTCIYTGIPFLSRMYQIQHIREWLRRAQFNRQFPTKYFPVIDRPPLTFVINSILIGLNPEYMVTDERDRIFGLIGLLRELGIEPPQADYAKQLPDLVFDAFATIAKRYNSLEFLNFVTGENDHIDRPSWVPSYCAVPWSSNPRKSADETSAGKSSHFQIEGRMLHVYGEVIDKIESHTKPINAGELSTESKFAAIDIPTGLFIQRLRSWLNFVRTGLQYQTPRTQGAESHLLFQLLLHPQITPFYDEASIQVSSDSPLVGSNPTHAVNAPYRLYAHFSSWLHRLETDMDKIELIESTENDHLFDQVQHFISSEHINIASMAGSTEISIGYDRALRVIQRWVREYVAGKRLFVSEDGWIGIAWQSIAKGDLIAKVEGVDSFLTLREVDDAGVYSVIGPCDIPGKRKAGFEKMKRTKFQLK